MRFEGRKRFSSTHRRRMARGLVTDVALVLGLCAGLLSCQDTATPTAFTPPPPPPPTTTVPLSADDLTGEWVGEAPDGMELTNGYGCHGTHDIYLDIVQSGNTLTGNVVWVVREDLGRPCWLAGNRLEGTLTGSANSGSVMMRWDLFWPDGRPVVTWQRLEGTATATVMSGRFTEPDERPPYRTDGTWVVRREE